MKQSLVRQLRDLAKGRCDYCRLPSEYDPLPFQVDHIIAKQHGGASAIDNLAWSCLHCNKHKGPNIAGIDPLSGKMSSLFHPRRQACVISVGMVRFFRAELNAAELQCSCWR